MTINVTVRHDVMLMTWPSSLHETRPNEDTNHSWFYNWVANY